MTAGTIAIVGNVRDPERNALAPQAFKSAMRDTICNTAMVPFRVKPADFQDFVGVAPGLRSLAGLVNMTPNKERVLRHCGRLTDAGSRTGVVLDHCRDTRSGTNINGAASVHGMPAESDAIEWREVHIASARRAAKAIASALPAGGAAAIGTCKRTERLINVLIRSSRRHYPQANVRLADATAVNDTPSINSPSPALKPHDALPFGRRNLPRAALVVVIAMSDQMTPSLAAKKSEPPRSFLATHGYRSE